MRYVSYEESRNIPNIIAHGRGNERSVLVLSHWPCVGSPDELRSDTSVEIALKYLKSPLMKRFSEITTVTSSRMDVDGLLSVWAILNPQKAFAYESLLKDSAITGNFYKVVSSIGVQVAIILEHFSVTCEGYKEVLNEIEAVLKEPARYSYLWEPVIEQIKKDMKELNSKRRMNEFPYVDLAVFDLPRPIHRIPLFSSTSCHRMLLIYPGPRYHFQYKYETWIEMKSYTPPPRIDLGGLAKQLQNEEHKEVGCWKWEPVSAMTPSLRFIANNGNLAESSHSPQALVARLIRYLEDAAENKEQQWIPKDWLP